LKSDGRCAARFSKDNSSLETYSAIGAKDLTSPVVKSFLQIQKLLALNS
jgi:hypothetical protein